MDKEHTLFMSNQNPRSYNEISALATIHNEKKILYPTPMKREIKQRPCTFIIKIIGIVNVKYPTVNTRLNRLKENEQKYYLPEGTSR